MTRTTLHVYDHCPYCIRARMPLGLKSIPAELRFLANDDEETPIRMIGAKMLPILEDEDGFMGESLDIVAKLDALSGVPLFAGDPDEALVDWIRRWGDLLNDLVIPRTADPVYPEFETASARAYFTARKTAIFGDFPELLSRSDSLIAEMEVALDHLVPLLPDPSAPSIDDILLFPLLRTLTVVEGLHYPGPVAAYMAAMSEASGVPLVPDLRAAG